MKLSLISRANNPTGMTVAEVERDIMQCSGFVKMMCGVANNCAYYVMMDALDHIRKHPRYADKSIKRLFEGKPNSALDFYKRYRNRLRWPMGDDNRFFHIADLTEEARRKYGAPITDEQYFEFWEATGGVGIPEEPTVDHVAVEQVPPVALAAQCALSRNHGMGTGGVIGTGVGRGDLGAVHALGA